MPEVIAGPAPSGAATTAPAPAAPQTAPARPQAPANKAPAPVSKPSSNLNDAYSQLDKMAGTNTAIAPEDLPAPEDAPTEDGPETVVETETAEPGDQKPTPQTEDKGQKPFKAADLRKAYDQLKQKYEAQGKELTETRQRVPEWEKHPERIKLTEQLAGLQKRISELDETVKFTDYSKSEEYKTTYEKPLYDAYAAGVNKVKALKVTDAVTGEQRSATQADFDALMRIQDDDVAGDKATELFGAKASIVLYHRERALELQAKANTALDEYRKNGAAREKQRAEQMIEARKQIAQLYQTEVQQAVEKYPQWFKAADGDKEGAEILEKAMHLADVAFGKPDKDPETGAVIKRTPAEMAKLNAAIRNKAGAFDFVIHQLAKERKLTAELNKKLAQYQKSEPGGGDGGRRQTKPKLSTWDQVEADLQKRAR